MWAFCVVHFLLFMTLGVWAAGPVCLNDGELAGVVFGSIFGTLLICGIVALALYFLQNRTKTGNNKEFEDENGVSDRNGAYANPEFRDENGMTHHHLVDETKLHASNSKSRRTSLPVFTKDEEKAMKVRRKRQGSIFAQLLGRKHSQSTESLNSIHELFQLPLKSQDKLGLGFNIYGNMKDGIFVRNLLSSGPAVESGRMVPGDRITRVDVNFENMVFEDALTILSYATPYPIVLHLERPHQNKAASKDPLHLSLPLEESERPAQLHPLFRSHSSDELTLSSERSRRSEDSSPSRETRRTRSVYDSSTAEKMQKKVTHLDVISETRSRSPLSDASSTGASTPTPEKLQQTGKPPVPPKKQQQAKPRAGENESSQEKEKKKKKKKPTAEKSHKPPGSLELNETTPARVALKKLENPYADLSPEERLQVLRLSYDDPETSQSTPNLLSHLEEETEEKKNKQTKKVVAPQATEILQKKENPEDVDRRSSPSPPSLPPPDWESGAEEPQNSSSSTLPYTPVSERREKFQAPRSESDSSEMDHEMAPVGTYLPAKSISDVEMVGQSYLERKAHLRPSIEKSNWLRPQEACSDDEMARIQILSDTSIIAKRDSGYMTLPMSQKESAKVEKRDSSSSVDVDKEQFEKLLYFQKQLALQAEELKNMGIEVPINLHPLKKHGNQSES